MAYVHNLWFKTIMLIVSITSEIYLGIYQAMQPLGGCTSAP